MRLNEEQIESPALKRYQQWWGVFSLSLQTWHAFAKSVGKLFMWLFYFVLISACSPITAHFLYNQMQDVNLKDKNRNTRIFRSKYIRDEAHNLLRSVALVAELHCRVSCECILHVQCCSKRCKWRLLAWMRIHCWWCHCREPFRESLHNFPFH